MLASQESYLPTIAGIYFLEREPKKFTCLKYNKWVPCNKEEICNDNLPYKPDKSEPEYLDNWVEKFNMLCETKAKVGMLGSAFFLGALISLLVIPRWADKYGRKGPFLATMILTLIS